jgi:hypothetical protein
VRLRIPGHVHAQQVHGAATHGLQAQVQHIALAVLRYSLMVRRIHGAPLPLDQHQMQFCACLGSCVLRARLVSVSTTTSGSPPCIDQVLHIPRAGVVVPAADVDGCHSEPMARRAQVPGCGIWRERWRRLAASGLRCWRWRAWRLRGHRCWLALGARGHQPGLGPCRSGRLCALSSGRPRRRRRRRLAPGRPGCWRPLSPGHPCGC